MLFRRLKLNKVDLGITAHPDPLQHARERQKFELARY
jgi:hypothetical protein